MSRPQDWWPLCDGDPVPGDPAALATLGGHLGDAAAEIERMAAMLPRICTGEVWDSDAGQAFREKAATTATGIGKTHRRFFTVARALGRSTHGGAGYAARLQEHQDAVDAAINAVNGTAGGIGSEAERRAAWNLLLDATDGADPTQPPPAHGSKAPPAGPMPQASPGNIPPLLPAFPTDSAAVATQKAAYNAAIGQLHASARAISQAVSGRAADAQAAASMILTAISNDGLNNPSGFMHWLDSVADDVGGYVSAHWVGFVKDLATIAGVIATVCGIVAMVLAFIPGMQEFAALFETVALLAQAVAFACHAVLLATGHGTWLDVIVDGIGLVTFGIGKGLIGGAEATADISEDVSAAYQTVAKGSNSVANIIEAGDTAAREAAARDGWSIMAKFSEQMKEVVSVRPAFSAAMKAWQDGKLGAALGDDTIGTLARGFKSALTMGSPEIGSALSKSVDAADSMPFAAGTAWVMTSRIESYAQLFQITQGTGIGTDLTDKLDQALNLGGLPLPGYDNLKSWLGPGDGG
jgi:hypothetical protein